MYNKLIPINICCSTYSVQSVVHNIEYIMIDNKQKYKK